MSVESTEDVVAADVTEDQDDTRDENPGSARVRPQPLEEEGDVAADYLEELLDIADIDGDIDIEVRNGRTYISIVCGGRVVQALDSLVGRDGEVLEALQELARLSVLSATENRSRLVLDINGYRQERAGDLQKIAEDAVAKVKESRRRRRSGTDERLRAEDRSRRRGRPRIRQRVRRRRRRPPHRCLR